MNEEVQQTISGEYPCVKEEIKGTTLPEIKVKAQTRQARRDRLDKIQKERDNLDSLKELAEYDTRQAEHFIKECKSILKANLDTSDKVDWASLYDDKPFTPFVFKEPVPRYKQVAKELGVPQKSFFSELFFPSVKNKRLKLENEAKKAFTLKLQLFEERKETAQAAYEEKRAAYMAAQSEYNHNVEQLQLDFEKGRPAAIESFARIALSKITVPDSVEVEFDAVYDPVEKLLVINGLLPGHLELPRAIRYHYHEEEHGIIPIEMEQKEFEIFYESILLQITLGAINIIFNATPARHVQWVGFNGWVKNDDAGDSEKSKSCILTCKVARDIFATFDLAKISPRECFLELKGSIAESLTGLVTVQPIINIQHTSIGSEAEQHPENSEASLKPPAYRPGDFKQETKKLVGEMLEQIEKKLTEVTKDKDDVIH